MRSSFSEYFRFTETEVDYLISRVLTLKPELKNIDIKSNIRNMYNGYTVEGKIVYNPWSIMSCLQALNNNILEPFDNYWANNGNIKPIKSALKNLKSTEKIEKLLIDGYVEFKYVDGFQFEKINEKENIFLSFLVDAGYLTKVKDGMFKIPNNEVKDYFYSGLLGLWLERIHKGLDLDEMKKFNMEVVMNILKVFKNMF